MSLKSPTAGLLPATGTVQLDARVIPVPGGAVAAPGAEAAQVSSPASDWARGLVFGRVKRASAAQTPAAHAVPATDTVAKAKPAQTPVTQPTVATTHPTPAKAAPARPAPARRVPVTAAPVAPARPYLIYDSVTPTAIPKGQQVATYSNGRYKASRSSVAGRGKVLWIDTNGSDPGANVLDVEPGDATPAGVARWVKARLNAHREQLAVVYTMLSYWPAVKRNVASLPSWMQARVRYWIADPTGVQHVVRGSSATQWYWGKSYDITTANPDFETP